MIDLHVHSTASDGTCAPAKIAEYGRKFAAMALTDHDNCDGTAEFLSACAPDCGLRLAGVELSVAPGEGYGMFHLLGLGIDPACEALRAILKRVLAGRNERNLEIVEKFGKIGINVPIGEVSQIACGEIVARPHFAKWLSDHGYAPDIKAAFSKYLMKSSPQETNCYVSRFRPDPEEAFEAIHAAGGVAVMAHPRFWTRDIDLLRKGLGPLKEKGLDGIEAIYQANRAWETVEHLRIARELGLCATAGSDFHGSNKPSVTLGMDVGDDREFLKPLVERLELRRAERKA